MKKLLAILVAAGFLGTNMVYAQQDQPKAEKSKKKSEKKTQKKGKKKAEQPKAQ